MRSVLMTATAALLLITTSLFVVNNVASGQKAWVILVPADMDEVEYGPITLGIDDGIYRLSGVSIEMKRAIDEDSVVKSVSSGDAEFGVISAEAFIRYAGSGYPIIPILQLMNNPWGLASLPSREVKSLSDLNGYTIGYIEKNLGYYQLLDLSDKAGIMLNLKKVNAQEGHQLLLRGEIDALIMSKIELIKLNVLPENSLNFFAFSEYGYLFPHIVVITNSESYDKRGVDIAKFIYVSQEAIDGFMQKGVKLSYGEETIQELVNELFYNTPPGFTDKYQYIKLDGFMAKYNLSPARVPLSQLPDSAYFSERAVACG